MGSEERTESAQRNGNFLDRHAGNAAKSEEYIKIQETRLLRYLYLAVPGRRALRACFHDAGIAIPSPLAR